MVMEIAGGSVRDGDNDNEENIAREERTNEQETRSGEAEERGRSYENL